MADLPVRRESGAGIPRDRRLKAGSRPGLAPLLNRVHFLVGGFSGVVLRSHAVPPQPARQAAGMVSSRTSECIS
jgi:hypothetical protein